MLIIIIPFEAFKSVHLAQDGEAFSQNGDYRLVKVFSRGQVFELDPVPAQNLLHLIGPVRSVAHLNANLLVNTI